MDDNAYRQLRNNRRAFRVCVRTVAAFVKEPWVAEYGTECSPLGRYTAICPQIVADAISTAFARSISEKPSTPGYAVVAIRRTSDHQLPVAVFPAVAPCKKPKAHAEDSSPWVYHPRCVRLILQVICLGLLCASVLFQQDGPPATDADRAHDIQAIYSWLITHSTTQDKLYLIAPEAYQRDYPRGRCLEIPADHTADFREIRADFDRRKNTRTVPKRLSTPKPYIVLDPDVAQELLKSALLSDSPIIREHFPGAQHLWLFSDVSFNQKRTVALVHVDSWCGGLCNISKWIAFEKGNKGVWQMRPWVACFAVA